MYCDKVECNSNHSLKYMSSQPFQMAPPNIENGNYCKFCTYLFQASLSKDCPDPGALSHIHYSEHQYYNKFLTL